MSEEEIKVIKTASCPSLSERSTISYEIGSKGDRQYIRLSGNSAGGLYSKDWISVSEINKLLAGSPKLTSKTLQPLYDGKSSNSPGFLLACIINEKFGEKNNTTAESSPETPPQKKSKNALPNQQEE
jgi:hypothetical protein